MFVIILAISKEVKIMSASFYSELWAYLKEPSVIIGLTLVIIGLVAVMLSSRIVRTVRKVDVVQTGDRMLLAIRIVGLVLIIIGFIVNATVIWN